MFITSSKAEIINGRLKRRGRNIEGQVNAEQTIVVL